MSTPGIRRLGSILLLLLPLALADSIAAQGAASTVTVRASPSLPVLGAVGWLEVRPEASNPADTLQGVEGETEGEPLHFIPLERGGFKALFGLPIDGPDSIAVSLRLEWTRRTDTTVVTLAAKRPGYGSERLRVDPALARLSRADSARVEAELARSREVSRAAHDTRRLWTAPFRVPRPSRITSVFGTAREYNGQITSRHLGTDFAGRIGAPVHAAARGVVALVANFYLAGRAVYLDHGLGLVTGYFHLSRITVQEGDTVKAGQVIGAVGRTGRVTGPHLHWIARYGRVTVDPMSLVRLREVKGESGER